MTEAAPLSPLERIPPHCIEQDLLAVPDQLALRQHVLDRVERLAPSCIGVEGKATVRPDRRNSLTLPLAEIRPWLPLLRDRIRARLPGICATFGIGTEDAAEMEFEAVVYRDGAFFRRHIDTQTGADPEKRRKPRVLSAVYYFHAEPRGFSGGALRLHPIVSDRYLDIDPQGNALLVFPSWAPHEVTPVHCSSGKWQDARLAINCWLRRAAPEGAAGQ